MDDGESEGGYVLERPYAGEWVGSSGGSWQESRAPAPRVFTPAPRVFKPKPPSERRQVERVSFGSSEAEVTAESMLQDARRQQTLRKAQDVSDTSKGQGKAFKGMSLRKFGQGNKSNFAVPEQANAVGSYAQPQRRKEQKEGKSLELLDLAFARPYKIVDGVKKSNYAPVSLPYFRVGDTEAPTENEKTRPTIQHIDEMNANAAKQLFMAEDGRIQEDEFFLMQFPSVLPEMLDPLDEVRDPEIEAADEGATLSRFPDGLMGKLRIHKSGKVRLEMGGIDFCVDQGCETFFQQDVACVCPPPAREVFHLGRVRKRMVLTPDIDGLLAHLNEAPPIEPATSSTVSSAPEKDSPSTEMPKAGIPVSHAPTPASQPSVSSGSQPGSSQKPSPRVRHSSSHSARQPGRPSSRGPPR